MFEIKSVCFCPVYIELDDIETKSFKLKTLAVSRKDNLEDFGLVGGKVEASEYYKSAMLREWIEETNALNITSNIGNLYDYLTNTDHFYLQDNCLTFIRLIESEKNWQSFIDLDNSLNKEGAKLKIVDLAQLADLKHTFAKYNARLYDYIKGALIC